jgi:hypothetical protein
MSARIRLRNIFRLLLKRRWTGAYVFSRSMFWGYMSTRCHQCGKKRRRWDCWNCPSCALRNIVRGLDEMAEEPPAEIDPTELELRRQQNEANAEWNEPRYED